MECSELGLHSWPAQRQESLSTASYPSSSLNLEKVFVILTLSIIGIMSSSQLSYGVAYQCPLYPDILLLFCILDLKHRGLFLRTGKLLCKSNEARSFTGTFGFYSTVQNFFNFYQFFVKSFLDNCTNL